MALTAVLPGVAACVTAQAVPQGKEEFASAEFVVGEGNWWSSNEELKRQNKPQAQELSGIAGFHAKKETKDIHKLNIIEMKGKSV